jgi:phosphopantothenate synthetase
VSENALLEPARIQRGEGRRFGFEGVWTCADQHLVPLEDGNKIVATPRAGHRYRAIHLERLKERLPSSQTANRARADTRSALPRRCARKVVVKGDGSEEVSQRNLEPPGNIPERLFRDETISIMEGM